MISLPDGWDEDLYSENQKPGGAWRASLRGREALPSHAQSKAIELLVRASEAGRNYPSEEDNMAIEVPPTDQEHTQTTLAALPFVEGKDSTFPEEKSLASAHAGRTKAFAVEALPGSDAGVREWTSQALFRAVGGNPFSFRASMRKGLIAVPRRSGGAGGTFRVRLLRLDPHQLKCPVALHGKAGPACNDHKDGKDILEMHIKVGFAGQRCPVTKQGETNVPRALAPADSSSARALLGHIVGRGVPESTETQHMHEAFELLAAFLQHRSNAPEKEFCEQFRWPPQNPDELRQTVRQLSFWLARVNSRTVKKFRGTFFHGAHRLRNAAEMEESAHRTSSRLTFVYCQLMANSVRGALEELSSAAGAAAVGKQRVPFDRLAAIIASCGGVSTPSVERRRWLRRQLVDWQVQGAHEQMEPMLWQIYCLLAGDVSDTLHTALDWRTALGCFLWYRSPRETVDNSGTDEMLQAVVDFEASVKQHGRACSFRPAPSYCQRNSESTFFMHTATINADLEKEPTDLQFNLIRAAVGLADWNMLSNYDAVTYSNCALDVAGAWHLSILLIAFFGAATDSREFQLLTHQYVLLLELQGEWEWALYVALFICEDRARHATIKRLTQKNAPWSTYADVQPVIQSQWIGLPEAWLWRAQAMRSEVLQDWTCAVSNWLHCGGSKRACVIALGFLQGPVLLGHMIAPLEHGPLATTALVPMTAPAQWLLTVLRELKPHLATCGAGEAWAKIGKDVLCLMCDWEQKGPECFECVPLVELYQTCNVVRNHLFGIPW